MVNKNRVRQLNDKTLPNELGVVVYWMRRDQRIVDNWALLYAQELAISYQIPLIVVYHYEQNYNTTRSRAQEFLINNLIQVESELNKFSIPFILFDQGFEQIISKYNIYTIVSDFSPLRHHNDIKKSVLSSTNVPFFEVDAHNIVPCWIASDKQEYTAATFRPKITKLLLEYLEEFPLLITHPFILQEEIPANNWDYIIQSNNKNIISTYQKYNPISGNKAGMDILDSFIKNKLNNYSKYRNNPNMDYQSNLSPYLHFGQIAPQRVVLNILEDKTIPSENKVDFLDEIIVRRELADNYCYYNMDYDNYGGFPSWAQKSLSNHSFDKREYIYTLKIFEEAKTHDLLWNAAQMELIKTGKMHGYMRMYWAKKILEWSTSSIEAITIANVLNDKYSLDGMDPNGYAGTAWSIGGLHDRPWFERPIFGQVRYMSYDGCRSKFDINKYIEKINQL